MEAFMDTRHHPVSEDVTLDRIDFEKLEQAQAERAERLRQYGTATSGVVGSKLRAHSIIAVVAILVVSFAVKMFYMSPPTAEAERSRAMPSAIMNILQMHVDHPNLPAQQINDMTFVDPLP
jgi:hypothetical protein